MHIVGKAEIKGATCGRPPASLGLVKRMTLTPPYIKPPRRPKKFDIMYCSQRNFPGGSDGKVSACSAGDPGLISGSGRSTGEGNGNPLSNLAGESQRQRSLVGYSPQGHERVGHD